MARRASLKVEPRATELLRVKYLQLARKYAALVARTESFASAPQERLTSASGRLATVAAALIENGVIFHASSRWTQIFPKVAVPKLLAAIPQLRAGGIAIHEMRLAGRDGARLVVRIEASPALTIAVAAEEAETWSDDGPASRARLWRGERLRALGQLAAAVAHDLSSTLRSVRYLLASIENDKLLRKRCGKILDSMARGLEDSSLVVGRLHDFARAGAQPLQAMPLGPVIAEAVRLAQFNSSGEKPSIEVSVAEALPLVLAAPGELVHVFLNLLRNGLEAGGGVSISAAVVKDRVRLVVADQGTGIAQEDLGRIFEPFFSTKGENGSGLGLFIVSTLLQRMGGSIGVANRQGGGALFSVDLPLAPEVSSPATPAAPARPGARRKKRAPRTGRRTSPA